MVVKNDAESDDAFLAIQIYLHWQWALHQTWQRS